MAQQAAARENPAMQPEPSETSKPRVSPEEYEDYRFLRLYSIDLDTAAHTLRAMRELMPDEQSSRANGKFLSPMLRDVIVTYGRPFSGNTGGKHGKHHLPAAHVPKVQMPLHDRLLTLRNKQFAHSDLGAKNPRVARWGTGEKLWFPMSFTHEDYQGLMRQFPEIQALVEAVERSVNETLRSIESRLSAR
jgi:hypothetical protein